MNLKPYRLLTFAVSAALLCLLLLAPLQVHAACGSARGFTSSASPKLPAAAQSSGAGLGNRTSAIVGLWHVTYYFDDGVTSWADSFDQWFSDGNEVEAADLGQGVLCQGTWKQVAPATYKLFHLGWSYDYNNLNLLVGSFTEEQLNTVSADGTSYHGTYHFTFYDLDGNSVGELSGVLKASRLAVN